MQFDIKSKKDRTRLSYEVAFYIMQLGYQNLTRFLYIPKEYKTEGGFPLGRIWAGLRDLYIENKLSEEEIEFLLNLRLQLADSPLIDLELWIAKADEVEAYYKEHGTLTMPTTTLFRDVKNMFQWLHFQKKMQKRGALSAYQIARLEKMNIQWIKPRKIPEWDIAYSYAEQYYEENGHLFVPRNYVTADGFVLGKWIQEQREKYLGLSRGTISDEKIDMLEDIGMFWEDLKNAEWDWFVGLLRECIRTTKKPFVIDRNYRYKNYALGEKVREVIQKYADGSLTAEQERDLRKIGFEFNIHIK